MLVWAEHIHEPDLCLPSQHSHFQPLPRLGTKWNLTIADWSENWAKVGKSDIPSLGHWVGRGRHGSVVSPAFPVSPGHLAAWPGYLPSTPAPPPHLHLCTCASQLGRGPGGWEHLAMDHVTPRLVGFLARSSHQPPPEEFNCSGHCCDGTPHLFRPNWWEKLVRLFGVFYSFLQKG